MSTETRLQALLQTTPAWLKTGGPLEDVVVSARVRLARNVADRAFPEQLADEDAEDIKHDLRRHAAHGPADKAACCGLTDGLLVKELARPPLLDDHVLNQQRELGGVRTDGDRQRLLTK